MLPDELVHISPIGHIPKDGQTRRFHLIVDLSSPIGACVKYGIDPELCSLSYLSVNEAVAWVRQCGPWALMAKLDLKAAYRKVPVHPNDQPLLGMAWRGWTFCDSPSVWFQIGPEAVHGRCSVRGLDDFFWFEGSSPNCSNALSITVPLCGRLGLPVAL